MEVKIGVVDSPRELIMAENAPVILPPVAFPEPAPTILKTNRVLCCPVDKGLPQ